MLCQKHSGIRNANNYGNVLLAKEFLDSELPVTKLLLLQVSKHCHRVSKQGFSQAVTFAVCYLEPNVREQTAQGFFISSAGDKPTEMQLPGLFLQLC